MVQKEETGYNMKVIKYLKEESITEFEELCHIKREKDDTLSFKAYPGAFLLPHEGKNKRAGIATSSGKFLSKTSFSGNEERENVISKAYYRDETAIYVGCIYSVWGHAFLDNFRFLWFLHTEEAKTLISKGAKLVYVCHLNGYMTEHFKELVRLADLDPDKFEQIKSPTQFCEVIVPDASFCYSDNASFSKEHVSLIDRIMSKIPNKVANKKVYFSRTRLESTIWREYGEYKIERIFREKGYCILHPETLSLVEQLMVLKNCTHFAATEGSIAHNSIFCHPGTEVTIIRKASYVNDYQLAINEMKDLNVSYVDAHHSVPPYPNSIWIGPFYLCITTQMEQYLGYKVFHMPYWSLPSYWWYVVRRKPLVEKYISNRKLVRRIEKYLSKCQQMYY